MNFYVSDRKGHRVSGVKSMLETVVPEQSHASAILPQDSTFLRITVNIAGGRLGVGLDDDYCVTQLKAGEPGEVAGLQVGDQIVEVNNVLVFEKEIASLIPRESDIIVLSIRRPPRGSGAASEYKNEYEMPTEVIVRHLATWPPLRMSVSYPTRARGLPEVTRLDAATATQLRVRAPIS